MCTVIPIIDKNIIITHIAPLIADDGRTILAKMNVKYYVPPMYNDEYISKYNSRCIFTNIGYGFYKSSMEYPIKGRGLVLVSIVVSNFNKLVAKSHVRINKKHVNMYIECDVYMWDIMCKIISGKYISMSVTPEDIVIYKWMMFQRMWLGNATKFKIIGDRIFNATAVLPRVTGFTDCVIIH